MAVRDDLAADLAKWITDTNRKPADLLFTVPRDLRKIFDLDLKAAGIAKRDDRNRTLDVHALRHTFGTLLSVNGVAPRTAQAAMRHADLKMTMNTYTDPRLLNVADALKSLPALPLPSASDPRRLALTLAPQLALPLALAPVQTGHLGALTVHDQATVSGWEGKEGTERKSLVDNEKGSVTFPVIEPYRMGATGIEPVTPSVSC